jgi:hypothetical protein
MVPAFLGGTLGFVEGRLLPGGGPFWALLGMAAGNSTVILPLPAATGAAHGVTVLLLKRSILTEKIARRGQHITREYSIDPFELLRVSDVMVTKVDTLPRQCRSMRPSPSLWPTSIAINPIRWPTGTGAWSAW